MVDIKLMIGLAILGITGLIFGVYKHFCQEINSLKSQLSDNDDLITAMRHKGREIEMDVILIKPEIVKLQDRVYKLENPIKNRDLQELEWTENKR